MSAFNCDALKPQLEDWRNMARKSNLAKMEIRPTQMPISNRQLTSQQVSAIRLEAALGDQIRRE
jgi:hypothetical protein